MHFFLFILVISGMILSGCGPDTIESLPETQTAASSTISVEPESKWFPETESEPEVLYPDTVYADSSLRVLRSDFNLMNTTVELFSLGNYLLFAESIAVSEGSQPSDTAHPLRLSVYDPQSGNTLYQTEVSLPGCIPADVRIEPDGRISVPSGNHQEILFLDQTLAELTHFVFPSFSIPGVDSSECILEYAPDYRTAYCVVRDGHELYRIDANGDCTQLFCSSNSIILNSVLFDGSYVCIYDSAKGDTLFLYSKTGELYTRIDGHFSVQSHGLDYLAVSAFDDTSGVILTGNAASPRFFDVMQLENAYNWFHPYYNWDTQKLSIFLNDDHTLYCYDLREKRIRAKNDLTDWIPEIRASYFSVYSCSYLASGEFACLAYDWQNLKTFLCLWNYEAEPQAEDTYDPETSMHFFHQEGEPPLLPPLTSEFDEAQAYANRLEETYHVEIRIAEECFSLLAPEYEIHIQNDPDRLLYALELLENALAQYPPDFFSQLRDSAFKDGLCIGLVSDIIGQDHDTLIEAGAITNTNPEQNIHWMAINTNLWSNCITFHHELSHVIENHINALLYDEAEPDAFSETAWATLNPPDFQYSYRYSTYDELDESYTSSEYWPDDPEGHIFFADEYSKTYPSEDRATLFSLSAAYGTDFAGSTAPGIQNKLRYMSRYLRHHFDTTGWPEVTPWERGIVQ